MGNDEACSAVNSGCPDFLENTVRTHFGLHLECEAGVHVGREILEKSHCDPAPFAFRVPDRNAGGASPYTVHFDLHSEMST